MQKIAIGIRIGKRMKKIILISLLLFFFVFPKNSIVTADDSSMSATASPTAVVVNDYTLPYPGLLPDNPLYVIKTIRDRIVTFFISDPLKKSSFNLLQSDKRLEASWYLLKKDVKNNSLALSTLSKSTTYFSLSIDELHKAQGSGEDINAQIDSIKNAIAKHVAVAHEMLSLPGLGNKNGFAQEVKRLDNIQKTVSGFSPEE